MKTRPRFKEVLVDADAAGTEAAERILRALGDPKVRRLDPAAAPPPNLPADLGKRTLQLSRHPGAVLKACPGTPGYICCGYRILHLGFGCPLDCSYCILQGYLNRPNLNVFVNSEERVDEVLETVDLEPESLFRIGTGEFMDSLALDALTGWTARLLPRFAARRNVVLEFKTKTTAIEGLLRLPQRERIVVSWSLNSPLIAAREEHGAASLAARLAAARRCQQEGFSIGLHFDPLVAHPGWEEGYRRTVELLERHLKPERIIWISLGSFRFMPALKPLIRKRHPASRVLDGEFVTGLDGKLRYFRPIRTELYAFLGETLRRWHPDPGLYLCMESDLVWRRALGWSPRDSAGLSRYLDGRVETIFG